MQPKSKIILFFGLLACLWIYAPRLSTPFIWDDRSVITFNSAFEHSIPLRDFFTPKYFDFSKEASWRPLTTLSYYLVVRVFGKSPMPMRALPLALHLLNGLILFFILKKSEFSETAAAWAVALHWVHAAHTESMLCAALDKEVLTAFGLLLMFFCHQRNRWTAAAAGYVFAMLSQETGALGLPLMALYDYCQGGIRECRKQWKIYCGYSFILAMYVFVRFVYLKGPGSHDAMSLPLTERIYYAFGELNASIRIFFAPVLLRVEYFALPPQSVMDWVIRAGVATALCLAIGAIAYYCWKKNRSLVFFWLWPLSFLFITSNLLPIGVLGARFLAERWLYLPYLGWVVLLAHVIDQFHASGRWAAFALMLWWTSCAVVRAQDWTDEIQFSEGLARIYPWSAKVDEALGEAYFRQGRAAESLAAFEKARELRETRQDKVLAHYVPLSNGIYRWESASLYRWLGHSEATLGHLPDADKYFRKALALDADDGFSYRIMAYSYARAGDFKRARQWLQDGLARDPHDDLLLRLKPEIERKKLRLHVSFS